RPGHHRRRRPPLRGAAPLLTTVRTLLGDRARLNAAAGPLPRLPGTTPGTGKALHRSGGPSFLRTPDRIRTGATALRGRRARPLHNGGSDHAFPQILLVYLDSNQD